MRSCFFVGRPILLLAAGLCLAPSIGVNSSEDDLLKEQESIWLAFVRTDVAKRNTNGREFLITKLDLALLKRKSTPVPVKEAVLDSYGVNCFPDTVLKFAALWEIRQACQELLSKPAPDRLRLKAYRFLLVADHCYVVSWYSSHDWPVLCHFRPDVAAVLAKEPSEAVRKRVELIAQWAASDDGKLRDKARNFLMRRPGNSPDGVSVMKEWLAPFPPQAMPDQPGTETLDQVYGRLEESFNEVSTRVKSADMAPLLDNGTLRQKAFMSWAWLSHEETRDFARSSDKAAKQVVKVFQDSGSLLELRSRAVEAAADAGFFEDVAAFAEKEKHPGLRAQALAWLGIAAREKNDEAMYRRVLRDIENEGDPVAKTLLFACPLNKPFVPKRDQFDTEAEWKERCKYWVDEIESLRDRQLKDAPPELQYLIKSLRKIEAVWREAEKPNK